MDAGVVSFLVELGSKVKTDQVLCEIESDKEVVEVTAPCDARLLKYFVEEGAEIKPLTLATQICLIGLGEEKLAKDISGIVDFDDETDFIREYVQEAQDDVQKFPNWQSFAVVHPFDSSASYATSRKTGKIDAAPSTGKTDAAAGAEIDEIEIHLVDEHELCGIEYLDFDLRHGAGQKYSPKKSNKSGKDINLKAPQIVVTSVDPGSNADFAGLKPMGYRFVAVDHDYYCEDPEKPLSMDILRKKYLKRPLVLTFAPCDARDFNEQQVKEFYGDAGTAKWFDDPEATGEELKQKKSLADELRRTKGDIQSGEILRAESGEIFPIKMERETKVGFLVPGEIELHLHNYEELCGIEYLDFRLRDEPEEPPIVVVTGVVLDGLASRSGIRPMRHRIAAVNYHLTDPAMEDLELQYQNARLC